MTTWRYSHAHAFLLSLLSFFATPLAGIAGLIVNENSTWPSAPVIETFPRTDANVESERDARFNRDLTQTFQVTSALQLDKVFLDVEEALPGKEVTIRLFTVANVNAADPVVDPDDLVNFPGQSLLFSQVYTTSAGINTGDFANNPGLVLEFDLTGADEVVLPANTGTEGYAIQIVRTGEGSDLDDSLQRAFKWHYNNDNNLYAGGRAYAIGGGPNNVDDFLMAIKAVPEPGTVVLGGLAVAGAALYRRRRRAV